jgi:hypothetical protein
LFEDGRKQGNRRSRMSDVSDTAFVKKWALAHLADRSLKQLADELGVSYKVAWTRSRRLMTSGVELPFLWGQKRPSADETKKLNQVIKDVLKTKGALVKAKS